MAEQYLLFVGIDWATQFHQACVMDAERQVLKEVKIEHSGTGIAQLVELLIKLSDNQPERVAVAIEMPRGALVEALLERHFAVFSLNPKQMDRFRDRHTVAGAKDDSRDAFVMADSLRTDLHLFHRAKLDEPAVVLLRELTRTEDDLQDDAVRTGHRLRELLTRYYPQMLKLCPGVDEPWFWELLELAPLPVRAVQLKTAKVEALLKKYRIRRLTADEILAELRVTALRLAPGAAEAASEHVLQLLPLLRVFREQQSAVAAKVQALLDELSEPGQSGEHRDVTILLSLPGVGRKIAATMLAEASQPLAERDYHALRTYSGTAPITRRSGKRKVVVMRQGCNLRLRDAFYHWSRVSTQFDVHSKQHYAELRGKGHSHGRALRGVVDRLLTVLMAMLRTRTLYDPNFAQTNSPHAA